MGHFLLSKRYCCRLSFDVGLFLLEKFIDIGISEAMLTDLSNRYASTGVTDLFYLKRSLLSPEAPGFLQEMASRTDPSCRPRAISRKQGWEAAYECRNRSVLIVEPLLVGDGLLEDVLQHLARDVSAKVCGVVVLFGVQGVERGSVSPSPTLPRRSPAGVHTLVALDTGVADPATCREKGTQHPTYLAKRWPFY